MAPAWRASNSIASEPPNPAMLTSLAATHAPEDAILARSRTSPGIELLRRSKDAKKGKSSRMTPSVQQARRSTCPAATFRTERTRSARPNPKAETEAGPSLIVRWPPTIGTSYISAASRSPSSTNSAAGLGPTIVSTMAKGSAPMAAKSLTLVRTAAKPAARGSASTKGGNMASPPTTS